MPAAAGEGRSTRGELGDGARAGGVAALAGRGRVRHGGAAGDAALPPDRRAGRAALDRAAGPGARPRRLSVDRHRRRPGALRRRGHAGLAARSGRPRLAARQLRAGGARGRARPAVGGDRARRAGALLARGRALPAAAGRRGDHRSQRAVDDRSRRRAVVRRDGWRGLSLVRGTRPAPLRARPGRPARAGRGAGAVDGDRPPWPGLGGDLRRAGAERGRRVDPPRGPARQCAVPARVLRRLARRHGVGRQRGRRVLPRRRRPVALAGMVADVRAPQRRGVDGARGGRLDVDRLAAQPVAGGAGRDPAAGGDRRAAAGPRDHADPAAGRRRAVGAAARRRPGLPALGLARDRAVRYPRRADADAVLDAGAGARRRHLAGQHVRRAMAVARRARGVVRRAAAPAPGRLPRVRHRRDRARHAVAGRARRPGAGGHRRQRRALGARRGARRRAGDHDRPGADRARRHAVDQQPAGRPAAARRRERARAAHRARGRPGRPRMDGDRARRQPVDLGRLRRGAAGPGARRAGAGAGPRRAYCGRVRLRRPRYALDAQHERTRPLPPRRPALALRRARGHAPRPAGAVGLGAAHRPPRPDLGLDHPRPVPLGPAGAADAALRRAHRLPQPGVRLPRADPDRIRPAGRRDPRRRRGDDRHRGARRGAAQAGAGDRPGGGARAARGGSGPAPPR